MIQISTSKSSFCNDLINADKSLLDACFEDLIQEEQQFFASMSAELSKLIKEPSASTITAILNYSKSL